MTLKQFGYVVEIARSGSINQAAQNLMVSQPSISAAVSSLENELGIVIFERTPRGIRPTNEGSEFIKYAIMVLEQTEDIKNRFSGAAKTVRERFSVSSQHYSFATDAFLRILEDSGGKAYNFSLREGTTLEIIEDVFTQKSELGVIYISNHSQQYIIRSLSAKNIGFKEVKQLRPHIFARPGHPVFDIERPKSADLAPYPFICYEQGEASPVIFSEELMVYENPQQVVSVRDRASMENIISKTDAYTIGTGYIIPGITGVGMASVVLEDGEDMSIGIIKRQDAPLSETGEAFAKYLKASLDKWQRR